MLLRQFIIKREVNILKLSENLLDQAKIIEDARADESATAPNLETIKDRLYDAAQEIDKLEAEVKESKDLADKSQELVKLGEKKIVETKEETLRMLKVVCEHSETKDMGRHDRMKERFEKETLNFESIERYQKDVNAEFDILFPPKSESKGEEGDDNRGDKENKLSLTLHRSSSKKDK